MGWASATLWRAHREPLPAELASLTRDRRLHVQNPIDIAFSDATLLALLITLSHTSGTSEGF